MAYISVQSTKEVPMVIMKWDIERGPDRRPTLKAQWTTADETAEQVLISA
jgi:hypothetical protein